MTKQEVLIKGLRDKLQAEREKNKGLQEEVQRLVDDIIGCFPRDLDYVDLEVQKRANDRVEKMFQE